MTDSKKGGKKANLGRGLDALFGENEAEDQSDVDRLRQSKALPVEFLTPSRYQPRRGFDDEDMQALIESVRARGVLQPLLVRRHPDDAQLYEIVAGERRWRAAQQAQLHDVPVIVKEFTDREALEIALIENIQRSDLSALEEAEGYRRLVDEFGYSQEALAQGLGKSRSYVANMLRLLNLPTSVQEMVRQGSLSSGHARALLRADQPETVAAVVRDRDLTVRQTEQMVRGDEPAQRRPRTGKSAQPRQPSAGKDGARQPDSDGGGGDDPDTAALERDLAGRLGLEVVIRTRGSSGELAIRYQSLEQLDHVVARLSGSGET